MIYDLRFMIETAKRETNNNMLVSFPNICQPVLSIIFQPYKAKYF